MKLPRAGILLTAVIGLAAFASTPGHAQIYKCVGKDGRVSFQDTRCIGTTGSQVDVRPSSGAIVLPPPKSPPKATKSAGDVEDTSADGSAKPQTQAQRDAAQLKAMETDRRRRAIDQEINEAVTTVESLKLSMEQDLAGLRARHQTLTNSVPGSVLATGATMDLQAATDRYDQQIRTAQDRVTELRKAREVLSEAGRAAERRPDAAAGAKP